MAPLQRRNPIDLMAQLRAAPHRFGFLQALRILSRAGRPGSPRVRFRTPASLAFPASELQAVDADVDADVTELTVGFLGLTGPAGVLPAPYTERLLEAQDAHGDSPLHAFLDLFSHRALELFHGAWRKYHPLALESAEGDGFTEQLLAMTGLALPREPTPPFHRLFARFAGVLAQRPLTADALVGLLAGHFGVPVALEQFLGHWIRIPAGDQCRLGRQACTLGGTALLGRRLWDRQSRVRLRIGPLAAEAFRALLPDRPRGQALARCASWLLGRTLACDLTLVLAAGQAPAPVLADRNAPLRLGVDLWLASRPMERELDDTRHRLLA